MKILLIDNGTSLLSKLEKFLPGNIVVKRWNESDLLSTAANGGFDLIILSGSTNSSVVWHHADFANEIELIRTTKTPLIGICFGCELIAHTFGGELKEMPVRHGGIREVTINDSKFTSIAGADQKIHVYEHHKWIISKMPENFAVLARSEDGPEAIQHESRPIYGLQFHPENFVEQTEGDDIFQKIVNDIMVRI